MEQATQTISLSYLIIKQQTIVDLINIYVCVLDQPTKTQTPYAVIVTTNSGRKVVQQFATQEEANNKYNDVVSDFSFKVASLFNKAIDKITN